MPYLRHLFASILALAAVAAAGCGGDGNVPMPPMAPTVTATAYILPGALTAGSFAFGDEPIVIYKGERLRWVNADTVTHLVVADSPDATDFRMTGELRQGGAQLFPMTMTRLGTTQIHCAIHPTMTGTLIVRER